MVFEGKNKKIAYAAGLDGRKIVPIQLITMLASSFAGVVTLVLFTEGKPLLAYLAATRLRRFLEDFFRILPQRLPREGGNIRLSAHVGASRLSLPWGSVCYLQG